MVEIKPIITLYDIYEPGCIFNPRASYRNLQWLNDVNSQHSTTGSLLTIAGGMPILFHNCVIEPSCLAIFEELGLKIANNRFIY